MTKWTAWCLAALAVFQLLIAVLLIVNWDSTVDAFAGKAFAPTRDAAEGAAVGSLAVHVVLAVLYAVLAANIRRRRAKIRATILLSITVVVGVVTLFAIPDATSLNPVGIVLAAAALVLLWMPSRVEAPR